MKSKNEPENTNSEQHLIYNLNSFRGSKPEKSKLDKNIIKPLPGNYSQRNLFSSGSEEKNKKVDIDPKHVYKPRILTGKLPLAFDINHKIKKDGNINLNLNNDDDSPKKLIKRYDVDEYNKENKLVCFTEGQGSPEIAKNKKQNSKFYEIKPFVIYKSININY